MEDSYFIDINLSANDKFDSITNKGLELFLQEVSIAIHTSPGEIWGIKSSIDLKQFLWNKYITLTQIRNEITSYIQKNCEHANYFQYGVDAQFVKVDNKELIYIEMDVKTEDNSSSYIQKFLLGS